MLKNIFIITFRNLWKDRFGTVINLLGFSTGIAAFLIIVSYLHHEFSYEKFNARADRIFRANIEIAVGGTAKMYTVSANIVGPRMKELVPEVDNYVRIFGSFNMPAYLSVDGAMYSSTKFYFADSSLFNIFSVSMLRGGTRDLLTHKNELILSESTAEKYFGRTDIEGRTIRVNNQQDFLVKGVFRDFPATSHLQPEIIAPFMDSPMNEELRWDGANFFTYLLLHSPSDRDRVEKKLQDISMRELPDFMKASAIKYSLIPIRDIHLYSKADFEPGLQGDIRQVEIFMAIAVFILLLAVVNYVNMATSRSIERAREVGLRKIMGSYRNQIIRQFLGESAVIALAAMAISFLIVYLSKSYIAEIFQRPLDFSFLLSAKYLLYIGVLWAALSFFAGLYPAIVLSKFEPAHVMKGSFRRSKQGILVRKVLVVFQFIISSGIITGTFIVYRQLGYMQNRDLGFDKNKVLAIQMVSNPAIRFDPESYKKQLLLNSNIEAVTVASAYPTHNLGGQIIWGEGMPEKDNMLIWSWETDEDYIKTLGLKLIAGKNLNPQKRERLDLDFVINETAMNRLGWTPENSMGKKIKQGDYRAGICVGVLKDFHFASLKSDIEPMMLYIGSDIPKNILVRVTGRDIRGTLKYMEDQWKSLASSAPFQYDFLDVQYNALYKNEVNTGRFFIIFAALAVIIACLGLFALSTFETLTRTKEIGIRKALGSTEIGIFYLLVKSFSFQVALSFIISLPLSWYLMTQWLQGFAYHIHISPWLYVLAGAILVIITLLTVIYHTLRAAFLNPVVSLRYE